MEDFTGVFVWLGIAVVFFVIYLIVSAVKKGKAQQYLSEAESAKESGNDALAINLLKKALWKANENPDLETSILTNLSGVYKKNSIDFNMEDYKKLIEQFRILKKKSSYKAVKELGKVNSLKKELLGRMPQLA